MSKYLFNVVNEKKSYSLTFLNKGGFIHVENLTYHNGLYCALNNISLEIENGDRVIVVGNYGKTVFLNIIAGLLWNYEGSVFVNKVNLQYVSPQAISSNVAYVMQIDRLFVNMTLRENILLGSTDLPISFDDILNFVELNNLDILLENGINTMVSVDLYIPIEVINKIAIARAIVRLKNAGILLMDNPYVINSRLCKKLIEDKTLVSGKTVIISDKGSEFLNFGNKFLFIDNGGNAYYSCKDEMSEEYYRLINSSLYS